MLFVTMYKQFCGLVTVKFFLRTSRFPTASFSTCIPPDKLSSDQIFDLNIICNFKFSSSAPFPKLRYTVRLVNIKKSCVNLSKMARMIGEEIVPEI